MIQPFVVVFGKAVRRIARLRGGEGSALPGLFVERIDPGFLARSLGQLPHGVILVSGTNGKTTTTKMVVELLEAQGLRVFTNRTGSNFTRGVVAALLGEISPRGKLDADIAVLELDEAHAVHFVRAVRPRYSLLLNVMRDQLDRFGEIDTTAKLLATIAEHTERGVILNREDPHVRAIAEKLSDKDIRYFGLDERLRAEFPSDSDLYDATSATQTLPEADVTLTAFDTHGATFEFDNKNHSTPLLLRGAYNIFNAAAALTAVRLVLGKECRTDALLEGLAHVKPAFGRGETITIGGQPLDLVLVKNPSGFRLGLRSFNPDGYATMIAINDNYADGRDMSWLWDVDFSSLRAQGVAMVSGIRAYDMALRLDYDEVPCEKVVSPLSQAVRQFIDQRADQPKRIYCTYTAMLALRRELGTITQLEAIDT